MKNDSNCICIYVCCLKIYLFEFLNIYIYIKRIKYLIQKKKINIERSM